MSYPVLKNDMPGLSPHLIDDQPEVLQHIPSPGVNLCLWQRPALPAIIHEVSHLQAPDLPDVRCATSKADFNRETPILAMLDMA